MSVNVLRRMLEKLTSRVKESSLGNPFFAQSHYNAHPLNRNNFNPIGHVESERRIAFLDGGNQEIVGAPNFSIQINRIYFCIFDGKERISPETIPNKIEFFSATYSVFRDRQVHYDTIIIPLEDSYLGASTGYELNPISSYADVLKDILPKEFHDIHFIQLNELDKINKARKSNGAEPIVLEPIPLNQ